MLFLCLAYMLVHSWQKEQMEGNVLTACWFFFFFFNICPHVCELKYNHMWYVYACLKQPRVRIFVMSHKWISFLIWIYFNNVHLLIHVGYNKCHEFHFAFGISPEACRLQNIINRLSIICCIFSAILIYGMINTVSCFCRFLHLHILFMLQDTKT